MSTKISLPAFRISRAALGRRLASTILKAREADLDPEAFMDTVNAVFDSCVSEDFTPESDSHADTEILSEEQLEIEKSVRRSAAARKAAERRRQMREQRISSVTEIQSPEEVKSVNPESEQTARKKRRRKRRRRNKPGQSDTDSQNLNS